MGRKKVKVAWPALKEAAIRLYDNLGMAMVFSLLWIFIGVAPLFFVYPFLVESWFFGGVVLIIAAALLFIPATCAVWEVCRRLVTREGAGAGAFFRFFGKNFKGGFQLGLANGFLFLVLAADLYFAFNTGNRFFQFMGGVWVWVGVFLLLLQPYLIPLLLDGNSILGVYKKAALLVLDNLGNTILVLLETVGILLLSMFLPPLLVLFFPVMIGFLHLKAYEIIMSKYEEDDDAQVVGT